MEVELDLWGDDELFISYACGHEERWRLPYIARIRGRERRTGGRGESAGSSESPRAWSRRRAVVWTVWMVVAVASVVAAAGHRIQNAPSATAKAAPPAAVAVIRHVTLDRRPVAILVYHHVAPARQGDASLWVTVAEFRRQLRYLRRHGYQPVTLHEVYDAWTKGTWLPAHPVVISFDDGYADQYRYAAAALRSRHWPAVLNLVVDNVGLSITATMVDQLIGWDWEIDSHTVTHRDLTRLSTGAVDRELARSRATLRRLFGVPVDFISYPGGAFDRAVIAAARRAGYLAATTIVPGGAVRSQLFALRRVTVRGGEPLGEFGGALRHAVAATGT